MECCYSDECGGYAVSPTLVPSCYPKCESEAVCYPCLPGCPKIVYCCPPPPRGSPPPPPRRRYGHDDSERYRERKKERYSEQERCCEHDRRRPCTPTQSRPSCCPDSSCCPASSPSEPVCCKPVRTKYVIPCYRYEDGRINQPTLLMRRACEVAVGNRHRKKPFVASSAYQDPYNEVRKYHSEDEKGNFCFHIERKKPMTQIQDTYPNCVPGATLASCPQCAYTDRECVQAKAIDEQNCCYFCN